MISLIKTDLRRILKDRLFMVVCIIGALLALVMPLLYLLIFGDVGIDEVGILGLYCSAKSLFFNSFIPSSNFGLIFPVLISIIVCKDFSQGTVRNKIICGKSRLEIFTSMFLANAIVICLVMLGHALITLGFSMLLFDYQVEPFTTGDLLYFFVSIGFEILVYILIASIVSFLCVFMKNVGLTIVIYIAINMIMSIVGSVLMVSIEVMRFEGNNDTLVNILQFINDINIFNATSLIGSGSSYTKNEVLKLILPSLFGTSALYGLGLLAFRRKDIK